MLLRLNTRRNAIGLLIARYLSTLIAAIVNTEAATATPVNNQAKQLSVHYDGKYRTCNAFHLHTLNRIFIMRDGYLIHIIIFKKNIRLRLEIDPVIFIWKQFYFFLFLRYDSRECFFSFYISTFYICDLISYVVQ